MRHNGRAPLLLSTLRSDCVTVDGDEIRSVVCSDCGTWRVVRRGMIAAHRAKPRSNQPADNSGRRKPQDWVPRCEGSGQRIKVDRRHREAMPAENRRAAQQFYKPLPGPAVPVHRIGSSVTAAPPQLRPGTVERARGELAEHRVDCTVCNGRVRCETGRELEIRLRETFATWTLTREQRSRREEAQLASEQRKTKEHAPARVGQWRRAMRRADALKQPIPAGAAPQDGPDVPLRTLHPMRPVR
jgi:hypothetical protein